MQYLQYFLGRLRVAGVGVTMAGCLGKLWAQTWLSELVGCSGPLASTKVSKRLEPNDQTCPWCLGDAIGQIMGEVRGDETGSCQTCERARHSNINTSWTLTLQGFRAEEPNTKGAHWPSGDPGNAVQHPSKVRGDFRRFREVGQKAG